MRPDEAQRVFSLRSAQRVLNACDSVLLQQFSDGATATGLKTGLQWHNLVLIGLEKLAIYWEPFGSALPSRGSIANAFESARKADGWRLVSVRLEVQTDGYQCGPWSHWFRKQLFECMARDLCASLAQS